MGTSAVVVFDDLPVVRRVVKLESTSRWVIIGDDLEKIFRFGLSDGTSGEFSVMCK